MTTNQHTCSDEDTLTKLEKSLGRIATDAVQYVLELRAEVAALKRDNAQKQQEIDRLRAAIPRVAVAYALQCCMAGSGPDTDDFAAFLETDAGKRALNEQPPRDG